MSWGREFEAFLIPVNIFNDIRILKLIYLSDGTTAVAAYFWCLSKLYGGDGWYIEDNEILEQWMASDLGISLESACEATCNIAEVGLFDLEMLNEHSILTSKEIQEHYFKTKANEGEAGMRRICGPDEYLLVSLEDYGHKT